MDFAIDRNESIKIDSENTRMNSSTFWLWRGRGEGDRLKFALSPFVVSVPARNQMWVRELRTTQWAYLMNALSFIAQKWSIFKNAVLSLVVLSRTHYLQILHKLIAWEDPCRCTIIFYFSRYLWHLVFVNPPCSAQSGPFYLTSPCKMKMTLHGTANKIMSKSGLMKAPCCNFT